MSDVINESESKLVPSPFVFHSGCNTVNDDLEVSKISVGDYIILYQKGEITSKDVAILRQLFIFGYATRRTLSQYVDTKDDCKGAIKKLRKRALISKSHFVYDEDGKKVNGASYYSLTSVGYQICKSLNKNGKLNITKTLLSTIGSGAASFDTPLEVLRSIALNNFRASFERDYQDLIVKMYSNSVIKKNDYAHTVKVMYDLNMPGRNMLIVPLPIRRNSGWNKEFNGLLAFLDKSIRESYPQFNVLFIGLVEDNIMACEAKKSLMSNGRLKSCSILFLSDWSSNREKVLENLVFVSLADMNKYDLVSIMTE